MLTHINFRFALIRSATFHEHEDHVWLKRQLAMFLSALTWHVYGAQRKDWVVNDQSIDTQQLVELLHKQCCALQQWAAQSPGIYIYIYNKYRYIIITVYL